MHLEKYTTDAGWFPRRGGPGIMGQFESARPEKLNKPQGSFRVVLARGPGNFERSFPAGVRVCATPPLLAIEILSPEDTLRAIQEKAAEYRQFGIEYVWIIDPEPRIAYRYTGSS